MATLTNDEIIEALKEKSLIEISDLVKQFEETFGVSAAAPVMRLLPGCRRRRWRRCRGRGRG